MKYPPFEIERFFRQHEFSAPWQISPSDCEPLTMDEILALAGPARREQFDKLWLGYTESPGHPELRQAIAGLHHNIDADCVLECVPEEGIFLAMNSLLSAGDHVVSIFPAFQSLYEVARTSGCELSFWHVRAEGEGWRIDLDELERLIRPDTKMLIINFPHNPSGFLPTPAEFQRIVELARRHDLILFSDEIYRFVEHDPAERLPSACELYEKALVLGGLSKCFGLPGLRVGWLISRDADIISECQELKSYTTICSSAPSEILALIALENAEALTARCIEIVRSNIEIARSFFDRHCERFRIHYPRAGTITLAELTADVPVSDFAHAATNQAGVIVLPASIMLFEGNYFRLGFGRRDLPHALEVFEAFVVEYFQ